MYKEVSLATHTMSKHSNQTSMTLVRWCGLICIVGLALFILTAAQAQQPRIMLEVPGSTVGNMIEICLQPDSLVDVIDVGGDVILSAQAQREDLGCPAPPGPDPVINNFVVSSVPVDPLDINGTVNNFLDTSSSNCDPDSDPLTEDKCLFVSWDVTPSVSPQVVCQISQTAGVPSSMLPTTFFNPGSHINSPIEFVPFRVNQFWPATELANGNRSYRLTCGNNLKNVANVVSATRNITFSDGVAGVQINSFNISQTSAVQGSNINFNWQVSSVGGAAINCTMSSLTTGVINPVNVTTASGNSIAVIRPDSPLGAQTFTFSCQNQIGQNFTDSVTITESSGSQCPAEPPNRDVRQTLFTDVFGVAWPGNNGNVENINVQVTRYKALRFTANAGAGIRELDVLAWFKPTSGNQESPVVSITQCPGDFNPDDTDCIVDSPFINGSLPWENNSPSGNGRCSLTPGETYYLNVRYPQCSASTCQVAFEL